MEKAKAKAKVIFLLPQDVKQKLKIVAATENKSIQEIMTSLLTKYLSEK